MEVIPGLKTHHHDNSKIIKENKFIANLFQSYVRFVYFMVYFQTNTTI